MGIRPSQAQAVYDEVFGQLRIECEALREMLALLAASVGGAVL